MEEELKQFFTPLELKVLELIEEAKKEKDKETGKASSVVYDAAFQANIDIKE